jgi:hypothetical protein
MTIPPGTTISNSMKTLLQTSPEWQFLRCIHSMLTYYTLPCPPTHTPLGMAAQLRRRRRETVTVALVMAVLVGG